MRAVGWTLSARVLDSGPSSRMRTHAERVFGTEQSVGTGSSPACLRLLATGSQQACAKKASDVSRFGRFWFSLLRNEPVVVTGLLL